MQLDVTTLVYVLFEDLEDFYIHATSSFSPDFSAAVTANEVESSGEISDHVNPAPVVLNITGFMSELEGQEELEEYDPEFVGDHIRFNERMQQAVLLGEPVSFDGGPVFGIYADMILTKYTPEWSNGGDGQSLNFSLSCQYIETTSAKTTFLEKKKVAAEEDWAKLYDGENNDPYLTPVSYGDLPPARINPGGRLDAQTVSAGQAPGVPAGVDWVRGG